MRIVFLAGLLFVLYSCNNDLNTIGDTMVPAEGYVNIETFDIETSTVRLDSFPTSLNILSNMLESNQLTLGKMTDKTTGSYNRHSLFPTYRKREYRDTEL